MPGVRRLSIDDLLKTAHQACEYGISALMLFPIVASSKKDTQGSEAISEKNIIVKSLQALQTAQLPIGIICDVALDPFTTHGHDGILDNNGDVDNDATISILADQALLYANHGANVIAPSDMQDGRVSIIRKTLEQHSHTYVSIMSYTAKYASSFYGPFRDAVAADGLQNLSDNGSIVKNKKSYQMSSANIKEAIVCAKTQLKEGADMLITKPAMYYLDVVASMAETTMAPIFAYQVSGEYTMLKHLAVATSQPDINLFYEALLSCKRAGATGIISYAALDLAKSL